MKTLRFTLALFLSIFILGMAGPSFAATIFATTDLDNLITFDSATPGTNVRSVPISGLLTMELVVAIDFRPATGQLYGLGYSEPLGVGTIRLLTITTDTDPAVVTQIGGTFAADLAFGFDFNPVSDRIRMVNSSGDNFRFDPDTGLVVVNTPLNPAGVDVTGIAYDNNFNGATVTTLFGIDNANSQLVMVGGVNGSPSPDTGTVSNVGGGLGTNFVPPDGFDIAEDGTAFAMLTTLGEGFFTINLATGMVTLVGVVDTSSGSLLGIAAQPEPSQLQFSVASYTVDESAGIATITVTRTGNTIGVDTVDFATSDGTAIAGVDYSAVSGTLTFADMVTSQTFDVPILDDPNIEGNETINLTLSNPTGGATLGSPNPAILTIIDNDAPVIPVTAVFEGGGCSLTSLYSGNFEWAWLMLTLFFVPILIVRKRIS